MKMTDYERDASRREIERASAAMRAGTKIETWVDAKSIGDKARTFLKLEEARRDEISGAHREFFEKARAARDAEMKYRRMTGEFDYVPLFAGYPKSMLRDGIELAKKIIDACDASADGKILMDTDTIRLSGRLTDEAITETIENCKACTAERQREAERFETLIAETIEMRAREIDQMKQDYRQEIAEKFTERAREENEAMNQRAREQNPASAAGAIAVLVLLGLAVLFGMFGCARVDDVGKYTKALEVLL